MGNNREFRTVRGYQLLMRHKNLLTPAMEDYLEMIYRNSLDMGYIRINSLSELLNVKPPSATKMVQKLTALGFLCYQRYGIILLTENGKEIGEYLLKRHNIIEKFLKAIGISDNLLLETELIEHNISVNTLNNIEILNNFLEQNPEIAERLRRCRCNNNDS